jgi:hypothetical protein
MSSMMSSSAASYQMFWYSMRAQCVVCRVRYLGGAMAGKKDMDATRELPEGEPTQVTEKGLKIGLPKRRDVLDALAKVAGKPKR